MSQRWHDLTAFRRDVLAAVSHLETYEDGAVYGLAIKRELQGRREREINHGQLYPNLDALVAADLLEKRDLDGRTNEYRLTEEGAQLLRNRLQRLALDCGVRDDSPIPADP